MELKVNGMMCMHCVNSVKDEIGAMDGVGGVEIDLPTKMVTIDADEGLKAKIIDAIEALGFEVEK